MVLGIENRYFGGNVDVTGLICAEDLLDQTPRDLSNVLFFMPSVMFNADAMTLDEYHQDQLTRELESRGARVFVISTMPKDLLQALDKALDL